MVFLIIGKSVAEAMRGRDIQRLPRNDCPERCAGMISDIGEEIGATFCLAWGRRVPSRPGAEGLYVL